MKTYIKKYPKLKYRFILSMVATFIFIVPFMIERAEKFLGIFIFSIVLFLAFLVISSLINIRDNKIKISFSFIVFLTFIYKVYDCFYVLYMPIFKGLIVSIVFAAIFALILRGITVIIERKNLANS